MMRTVVIFLALFFSNSLIAQDSLYRSVFDVSREGPDSLNIVPLSNTSNILENLNENANDGTRAIGIEKDNPFDVNHIPIRRSQLVNKDIIESKEAPLDFFKRHLALWVAIIGIALYAIAVGLDRDITGKLFRSCLNENQLAIFQRDYNGGFSLPGGLLFLTFTVGLAYFFLEHYVPSSHYGFNSFLLINLGILGAYFIKWLILSYIKTVFPNTKKVIRYYLTIGIALNGLLGLGLIFFNFLYAYGPQIIRPALFSIIIGLGVIALLIRYAKVFLNFASTFISQGFYFLLYLCATEIAPALILLTMVRNGFIS